MVVVKVVRVGTICRFPFFTYEFDGSDVVQSKDPVLYNGISTVFPKLYMIGVLALTHNHQLVLRDSK